MLEAVRMLPATFDIVAPALNLSLPVLADRYETYMSESEHPPYVLVDPDSLAWPSVLNQEEFNSRYMMVTTETPHLFTPVILVETCMGDGGAS